VTVDCLTELLQAVIYQCGITAD